MHDVKAQKNVLKQDALKREFSSQQECKYLGWNDMKSDINKNVT